MIKNKSKAKVLLQSLKEAKLEDFINANKISISSEKVSQNPHMPNWSDANHWKVTLKMGSKKMSLFFSRGYGYKGKPPSAEEVLDVLASDIHGGTASDFEEWANNLGYDIYDPKIRKDAKRTYSTIIKQSDKLKSFLGDDLFDELLYDTDNN